MRSSSLQLIVLLVKKNRNLLSLLALLSRLFFMWIFVFVSWVGGGNPPWLCPKCLSPPTGHDVVSEPIFFAKYVFLMYKLEVWGENCSKNCQKLLSLVVFSHPAILCSIWGAAPQQLFIVFLSQAHSYLFASTWLNHLPFNSQMMFQIVWID